jgi:hypothetical protein
LRRRAGTPDIRTRAAVDEHWRASECIGASLYRYAVDSPSVRFNLAEAASLIDTARLHSFRAVEDVEDGIRDRAQLDLATRARIRMDVGSPPSAPARRSTSCSTWAAPAASR